MADSTDSQIIARCGALTPICRAVFSAFPAVSPPTMGGAAANLRAEAAEDFRAKVADGSSPAASVPGMQRIAASVGTRQMVLDGLSREGY